MLPAVGCQFCPLECSAHGKPESASLSGQGDPRKLFCEADNSVRVVVVNETERYIYDRHLHPQLQTDTRPEIADLIER